MRWKNRLRRRTRPCGRLWRRTSLRATRCAWRGQTSYPTLSVTPAASRDQVVVAPATGAAGNGESVFSDFQLEGPGQLGAGLLGTRASQRRSRTRECPGKRRRPGESRPESSMRNWRWIISNFAGLDSDARLLERTVTDYQNQLELNQRLVKGGSGDRGRSRTGADTAWKRHVRNWWM